MTKFVHLNLHTEYSLIDGLIKVKSLIEKTVENQMPAVAITDHSNLFSLVKFYKAALNSGVKPIIGANILIYDDLDIDNKLNSKSNVNSGFKSQQDISKQVSSLILLCKSTQGYKNLTVLLSKAYTKGQMLSNKPLLYKSWLDDENTSELIVL